MKSVKVSSTDQVAVPKTVRKKSGWKKLQGAAGGTDLIKSFAAQKKREREHERRS